MDFINITIGMFMIIAGVLLIFWITKFTKKQGSGGFSFKLGSGGIGFIIIGTYLIAVELVKMI